MKILAIETSCDETAVAVVESGSAILSNVVSSQISVHKDFGGVIPEVACRIHEEVLLPILEKALKKASLLWSDIDAFAVTHGPGLVGALMVGVNCAKTLSFLFNKPLIAINHLEAHIYANFMTDQTVPPLPCISLIVSGGHTMLLRVNDWNSYVLLGQTCDDAVGEAFDKVAKMLSLGYPGGPVIDRLAKEGDPLRIHFPRARVKNNIFDFSFSGVKTAVFYHLRDNPNENVPDVCACFQEAVVDVLWKKCFLAMEQEDISHLCVGGGVSMNTHLRSIFSERSKEKKISVYFPPPRLSTDNAAMIGGLAFEKWKKKSLASLSLDADPKDSFFSQKVS